MRWCVPAIAAALGATDAAAQRAEAPAARGALAIRAAHAEWDRAEAEWRRTAALHARDMASEADLEERAAIRTQARLRLVEEAIGALEAAPHVMIERALRRPREGGVGDVVLTLRVAPMQHDDVHAAVAALAPEVSAELAAHRATRAFVSLKSAPGPDGVVVAAPYERMIESLAPGRRATVVFRLVRDVADVVVSIEHGGRVVERRIVPETDGARLDLEASQPAQEGDLGSQVSYPLTIARAGDGATTARITVAGLPPPVAWELREADGDARLTLVRFGVGEREKRLRLLVALPVRPGEGVAVDERIAFDVRALVADRADARAEGAARVALELTPRGVAQATLRLESAYLELRPADSVYVAGTVHNDGTGALADVRITATAPPGWRVAVRQPTAQPIANGGAAPIGITLTPGRAVETGDYEVRMRVDGGTRERPVASEERVLRVRIHDEGGVRALWIALALAAFVAAMLGWLGRRMVTR